MRRAPEAVRFALAGAAGLVLAMTVTLVGHEFAGMSETLSFAVAAAFLYVFHFAANALYVFRAPPTAAALARYAAASLLFRLAELVVFAALDRLIGLHYTVAAAVALGVSATAKFLVYRTFVFVPAGQPGPRILAAGRETARIAVIAGTLLAIFFGAHHLGNQIPHAVALEKLRDAYERHMVWAEPQPRPRFQRHIRLLAASHPFPDCRMLGSVIVPSTSPVADMVVPKALAKTELNHCARLHRAAVTGDVGPIAPLKPRYWHGTKAFMGIGLAVSDVFTLVGGIKTLTYFAYALLALAALRCSRETLYVLSPFIVFGFFFSAIPYFGGFGYSVPYLHAVLALAGLVALVGRGASPAALGRYSFGVGMVSAYLFLLDGHLISLLPMTAVVLYFASPGEAALRNWFALTARCLSLFAAGFAVSMAANVAAKSWYVPGLAENFGQAAARWMTRHPQDDHLLASMAKAVARSFHVGFSETSAAGNRNMAYGLLLASLGAALGAALLCAGSWCRRRRVWVPAGLVVVATAGALVLARMLLVSWHTYTHVQTGRYWFVPLALCWTALVVAGLALRRPGAAPR